jgi:hypothetical protein
LLLFDLLFAGEDSKQKVAKEAKDSDPARLRNIFVIFVFFCLIWLRGEIFPCQASEIFQNSARSGSGAGQEAFFPRVFSPLSDL